MPHDIFLYSLIFFGMLFEGDAVLFVSSFLVHRGVLDFWDVLSVALIGALVGDAMWYWIGTQLKEENFLSKWFHRITHPFDDQLQRSPFYAIFVSKFMYGFHHALLFRAGALRISKKKFFSSDLVATLFWMSVISMLAYGTSLSIHIVRHYVRVAELTAALVLILYILLEKKIARILKK